jgi:hypothetical protein
VIIFIVIKMYIDGVCELKECISREVNSSAKWECGSNTCFNDAGTCTTTCGSFKRGNTNGACEYIESCNERFEPS